MAPGSASGSAFARLLNDQRWFAIIDDTGFLYGLKRNVGTSTETDSTLRQPFRIGGLIVDPARRKVERDGEPLTLEPRAFDVLLYLASQNGRVVSKEELLEVVWRGRVVTDDSVYRAVRVARDVFDNAGPKILQTVHRRGYRCVADVAPLETERRLLPPRMALVAIAAMVAMVAIAAAALLLRNDSGAAPETGRDAGPVAVLPFEAEDGRDRPRYFGEGLAGELISDLGRVHGIDVIAATSSFRAGNDKSVVEIGASTVVDGSWRRNGEQIAVHVEIRQPETERLVWSRTFRRPWDELAMLRTELAETVAGVLEHDDGGPSTYFPRPGSADAAAYNQFLLARHLWRSRDPAKLDRAIELLQRSIAQAPDFALAHEALASAYTVLPSWQTVTRRPVRSLAFAAAREALRLDPRLGEARAILGHQARERGRWDEAERLYRRALDNEPGNATISQWIAEFLLLSGRLDEAVDRAAQAVELDPMAPMPHTVLAWAAAIDGRNELAAHHARRAIDLGMPSTRIVAAWAAARLGQRRQAAGMLDGLLRPSAAIEPCRSALAGTIDPAEAVRAITDNDRSDELAVIYHTVCLAMLDSANSVDEVAGLAPRSMALAILWAEEFDEFRAGPTFTTLLERAGLDTVTDP